MRRRWNMIPHTVRFPCFLWKKARALARDFNIPTAQVIREALAIYISLHEAKR
jgi:hypothetical protein